MAIKFVQERWLNRKNILDLAKTTTHNLDGTICWYSSIQSRSMVRSSCSGVNTLPSLESARTNGEVWMLVFGAIFCMLAMEMLVKLQPVSSKVWFIVVQRAFFIAIGILLHFCSYAKALYCYDTKSNIGIIFKHAHAIKAFSAKTIYSHL